MKEHDTFSNPFPEDDDFDVQACATMDCTGLIPALPSSEAELESYEELYSYLPTAKTDSAP